MGMFGRREFLGALTILPALDAFSGSPRATAGSVDAPRRNRLFFTSQGKTDLVSADGSGLRYFQLDKPDQATWQPGGTFPGADHPRWL